jgi:hypothetical protein
MHPALLPHTGNGRTISQPAESDDESDAESCIDSEADSDKESVASVLVVSSQQVARAEPLMPIHEALGSQANPWSVEEVADPGRAAITIDLTEAEANAQFHAVMEEESISDMDNDSVVSNDEVDSPRYSSDSSSDSDASADSEDRIDEHTGLIYFGEGEEEDNDEDYVVDEEHDEAFEQDDHIPRFTSQSPQYAPSSPTYTAPPPYKPLPHNFFGQRQEENDVSSMRNNTNNNSEYSYAYSPPPQFQSMNTPAYMDGPFMNPSVGFRDLKPYPNVGISGEQFDVQDLEADIGRHQPWLTPLAQPQPGVQLGESPAMGAFSLPNQLNVQAAPLREPVTSIQQALPSLTTSTRDMIKNDMSIDSLINPPSERTTLVAGKKRRAEEMDDGEVTNDAAIDSSAIAESSQEAVKPTEPVGQSDVISSTKDVTISSRVIAKPVSKRRKLAYGIKCAALGSVIGVVGTFATMMSLPDSIFQ